MTPFGLAAKSTVREQEDGSIQSSVFSNALANGRSRIANIRIGIAGAGRMGQAIAQSVDNSDDLVLAGIWQRGASLDDVLRDADVLIDFSLPEANAEVLQAALAHQVPLVCGVSGLSDDQMAALRVRCPSATDRF